MQILNVSSINNSSSHHHHCILIFGLQGFLGQEYGSISQWHNQQWIGACVLHDQCGKTCDTFRMWYDLMVLLQIIWPI